jgi:multiple sugar transport system substrate-binding protein
MTPDGKRKCTRRVLLGGGAVGTVGVLAACAVGGAGEQQPQVQRAPKSVPLAIWARNASDKLVFDQIGPLAEAKMPHLAITTEIATDIYNKLIVAVAASTPPDLTVVNVPNGVPMMGQGFFLKMQPYLAKDRATDQELKSFAPAAVQAYRQKNEQYAVPVTAETIVLWYNADLLRQANLTPPAEIENDPQKWNWDTVLDYARKLNRGREQGRESYGLYVGPGVQASWGNLVLSNGGRILNEELSKMLLSEPAAVEGVQWCVDAMWRHDVAPQPAALRATPVRELFNNGRLGMAWEGEFFRRGLFGPQAPQGVPFKFDLAQIPFAPRTRKRVNAFHTLGLPILRESKMADGAWEFVRVFVGRTRSSTSPTTGDRGAAIRRRTSPG